MSLPAWHEEPISKKHDRKSFDCGDSSMNEFLQRYARQSHESGAAKTFLAIDNPRNKAILGFYSLAPGALAYADTPESFAGASRGTMCLGFVSPVLLPISAFRDKVSAVSSSPRPRGAACALRLKSGELY
jgi:hypothetical protein